MSFTYGTFNLLKKNTIDEILEDLSRALHYVDVLALQENQRHATRNAIEWIDGLDEWSIYDPKGAAGADPIAWRTEMFDLISSGYRRTHDGKAGVTPARYVVWVVLKHLATGKTVCFLNTHVINGYAGQDMAPRALRDRDAEAHWRTVVDVTWEHKDAHDALLLAGDFNVRLANHDEPWYPGNLLKPLYEFDHGTGIDHVLVAKGSRVKPVRHRTIRHMNSDHNLHYTILEFTGDQPEEDTTMRFVSRADWGSSGTVATPANHPIGKVYGITAHWEGPGMGGFPHSRCARKVRTIERFHKVNRGWADIAYNAIVCPHGYVFEGRGPNTRSAANGTSDIGGNDHWYAVCYLGGKGDRFTIAGRRGFLDAFSWLTLKGDAGPRRNGHRDHHATACPGDSIYRWVHSPNARQQTVRDWFNMASKNDLEAAIRDTRITIKVGEEKKEWRLETVLAHLEQEQDTTQRMLKAVLSGSLDPDRLADLVASKINADLNADADVVKAAVKQALAEGVNG